MSVDEGLRQSSERLRTAIREERYDDAAREMRSWRAALDAALAAQPGRADEILRDGAALLEWGRVRTLAGRARLAAQLAALSVPNPYTPHRRSVGSWSVLA